MSDVSLVVELTILVLAAFLGFEVISKVPTYRVSGVLTVIGGWFVTDRMLGMFKRRPEPKKDES